jgi:hypothetical protein
MRQYAFSPRLSRYNPHIAAGPLSPFGMHDPDLLASSVENDGVRSIPMTDYADSGKTLRVRPIPKAAADLSVSLEIDDFVDHGVVNAKTGHLSLNRRWPC